MVQRYDKFGEETEKMIEKIKVVHERSKDDCCYFADFYSVRDFKEEVMKRGDADMIAPSDAWIRFQFYPTNPYVRKAAHYTGRYKVKWAIQQRLLQPALCCTS